MDKAQVAQILEEIGTFLEFKGENPFKARAYHNASRLIGGLDKDLTVLVREEKLSELKGIGESIAEKITTLVTTGRLPFYDDLQKSLPSGFLQIVRVQGVGPKRAQILCEKLKICDLAGLEKACQDGRIAKMKGFGEKTQENI